MTLVLVTATELEMRRSLGAEAAAVMVPARGTVTARLGGREVLLLVTGVGPVNSALEIGALLATRTDISGVLNLGLAGSFDLDRAPLGAVAAATEEIWPEYGLAGEHGLADARAMGFAQHVWDDFTLWDTLPLDPQGAARKMGLRLPEAWPAGPSVTVAGVSVLPGRVEAMRDRFSALTENMEGFALALACRARSLPFLEVRTVSNQVGQRDKSLWNVKAALSGLGQALAVLFGPA